MSLQKKAFKRTQRRILRTRSNIHTTKEKPRVSVFRSLRHFYAQIIDETKGMTLVSCSSHNVEIQGTKKEVAFAVGKLLAERAAQKGIVGGVLDRGPYKFHGRVEEFTRALRETGFQI